MKRMRKMVLAAAMLGGIGLASPAFAADNVMQACGAKYQAAKAAKTLPAGQTWMQYLAACRASMAKPAAAAPAPAPAARPARAVAAKPAGTPGQPSAAQKAMYDRERQCGAKWRADKAAGKVPASQTWPQYWSACNKTMK